MIKYIERDEDLIADSTDVNDDFSCNFLRQSAADLGDHDWLVLRLISTPAGIFKGGSTCAAAVPAVNTTQNTTRSHRFTLSLLPTRDTGMSFPEQGAGAWQGRRSVAAPPSDADVSGQNAPD